MRKGKKLEFKTKRHVEKAKKKKYYLIFFIFLLVFGMVSTLVLLKSVNFDLSNLFEGRETETATQETTQKTVPVTAGSANFLAVCVSDDRASVRFIAVINAELHNKRIRTATLSPKMTAKLNGKFSTLEEHFKQGGTPQVAKAIESLSGISIKKYVCSTDSGFNDALRIVDKAGKFTVPIEKTINHRDDKQDKHDKFDLFIPAGDKAFNGEILLKYFRYLGLESTEDGLFLQAQTISAMLRFFITPQNAENGEELFGLLYNCMDEINITGLDFNNSEPAIESIIALGDAMTYAVEQGLTLFAENAVPTTGEGTGS